MNDGGNIETSSMGARSQKLNDVLHEIGRIEWRRLERNVARFHAREIQHVVKEIKQSRAGFTDGAGVVQLGWRELALFQQGSQEYRSAACEFRD